MSPPHFKLWTIPVALLDLLMMPLLEINRTVVVYLPTYISMHRTRVEFLVP